MNIGVKDVVNLHARMCNRCQDVHRVGLKPCECQCHKRRYIK